LYGNAFLKFPFNLKLFYQYMNKRTITFFKLPFLLYVIVFMQGCTQTGVFENSTAIPSHKWSGNFAAKGSFIITDTTAAYDVYIVLRHTDAYGYSNIWLNAGIQPPADSMRYNKINMELATDAAGWMGTGMNDIWEVRQLLFTSAMRFKKAGTYSYSLQQIMRDEPLAAVMSAGLRIEKRTN
jgi:gliding motility-associated lipoprotein GldH